MSGKQQFNVYLSAELVRAVKHRAIDEGESLSTFVARVLTQYLERVGAPAEPTKES